MTKTPAMPEHRIPDDLLYLCESEREAVRRYANAYALAALQSAQPAEVSDEEIDRICYLATEIRFAKTDDAAQAVIDKIRAILALRPQAVPMTREEKLAAWKAATIELPSPENCYLRGLVDAEAHHGITQRADGGEKQA